MSALRKAPATVPGRRAVRVGGASAVWRPRAVLVPVALAVVALLLAAVDAGRGDYPIGVLDVLRILAGGGEAADRFVVVGRVLVLPAELPVGLVLAFVGAPFFIALVRRRRLVTL